MPRRLEQHHLVDVRDERQINIAAAQHCVRKRSVRLGDDRLPRPIRTVSHRQRDASTRRGPPAGDDERLDGIRVKRRSSHAPAGADRHAFAQDNV